MANDISNDSTDLAKEDKASLDALTEQIGSINTAMQQLTGQINSSAESMVKAFGDMALAAGSITTSMQALQKVLRVFEGEHKVNLDMDCVTMAKDQLRELAEQAANTPLDIPKPEDLGIKEIGDYGKAEEVAANKHKAFCDLLRKGSSELRELSSHLSGSEKQWVDWGESVMNSLSNTMRNKDQFSGYVGFLGDSMYYISDIVGGNAEEWLDWGSKVAYSFEYVMDKENNLAGYVGLLGDTVESLSGVVGGNAEEWLSWSGRVVTSLGKILEAQKEVSENAEGLGESLEGKSNLPAYFTLLSESMKELSGMVGGNAEKWLEWSAGVVDSFIPILDGKAELQDYFSFIGGTMSGLSELVGGNAGQWLEWGANVMNATSGAIVQIMALLPAKKADAAANTTQAGTGAAAAVSKIPIIGPILAVAAVASVLAAIASIPKMASGGIAYGPTMALFGEYAGAGNNPEIVAPLSKLRTLIQPADGMGGGRVEFKIQGRELVGLLSKMNTINSRVNG